MEALAIYTAWLLDALSLEGTSVVLGNSISAYAFALITFGLSLAVLALAQYFSLAWLTSISERTNTNLDNTLVKMLRGIKPPFYLVLAVWVSTHTLSISGIVESVVNALLILWIVLQAATVLGILVEEVLFQHFAKEKDENTKSALHLLTNLAKAVLWVVGILLALSNMGVNVTSLIAGAGIAGIAIAFALQGILTDLFSSFSIYFDKPFKVGDFIAVGDTLGTVKHIGVKSTRIESLSGEEITLSNQVLTKAKIQNYQRMQERRVVLTFGILYETSLEKVRLVPQLAREVIEQSEKVRFDRAHIFALGESALTYEVVYFVLDPDYTLYMDIQQDVIMRLMERFREQDIGFAYPTRTVHLTTNQNL